jgi:elongation factor G
LKEYPTPQIRNVALAGHTSAGKTSLVEALNHQTKVTDRLLKVDEGNTLSDYDPEEIRRRTSINASLLPIEYNGHKINFLDVPGYRDFIGEIKNALRVADSVLFVVDGTSGAEVGLELAWEYAEEFRLPRAVFLNKMDKERADFDRAIQSLRDTFEVNFVPLALPVGKEAGFQGVIDLVQMKLVKEAPTQKAQYADIPADLADEAQLARLALVEAAAEGDDALTEKFLEDQPLTPEEVARGLKGAFREGRFVPVLCGSALRELGLAPLLDFIVNSAPNPSERPALAAHKPGAPDGEAIERPVDPAGPFSAYVFKTIADDYAGRVNFFKVLSGTLTTETPVHNTAQGRDERIGHILIMRGRKQDEVNRLYAGDIGAVAKLAATQTGDTLCHPSAAIEYEKTAMPARTYSMAIVLKSKADEEKVSIAMHRFIEQDPTLELRRDPEIHQTILSGMGDTHLDVALARVRSSAKIEADLEKPRIPYHETITRKGTGIYRHKKQTGGRGQFAEVHIRLEPLPEGQNFEFVWEVVGGNIPTKYQSAVEKGVVEAMERGIVAGYTAIDIKAACYDGKYHDVDSSDMAFKLASIMGFRQVAAECSPIVLEPIYNVKITVPESNMGDIMGDISGRRGRILGTESIGRKAIVSAQVPLAEMATYTQDLRSMTQGRGVFEMTYAHYERVPGEIQTKIVEDHAKRKEEEAE